MTPEERAEFDRLANWPTSFRSFVQMAHPDFHWYEPHQRLANALQRVADGHLKRLMVFMPPQEGKSLAVTRLFPAYYLTEHPARWIGLGSYAMPLARGFSRDARAYYERVTGQAGTEGIRDDAGAVEEWQTTEGGGLWAVGRGGSATGRSAHLFVVDDPLKDRSEAESETIRSTLHGWYKSVVNMRLQPENAVIIVNTRWHEDDLSGHLLALEKAGEYPEHWHIVDLPGICEEQSKRPKYPKTCTVEPEWRSPGDPLGGRYSIKRYEQVRAISGPREYESQIQQRPSAQEGSILKRNWWKYYDAEHPPLTFEFTVISVDCAFKDTDGSDYVAMQVWGEVHGKAYLREKIKARLDYVATKETLRALMKRYRQAAVLVEDKANGSAVIADLRQDLTGILAVNPEGGKVARAYSVQGLLAGGKCYLPARQVNDGWQVDEMVEEFIAECASFPNATHDDEVDAFTQAMDKLRVMMTHGTEPASTGTRTEDTHPGFNKSGVRNDRSDDDDTPVRVPVPRMPTRGAW
jgi:predicted phage terminase large subunit-like protein